MIRALSYGNARKNRDAPPIQTSSPIVTAFGMPIFFQNGDSYRFILRRSSVFLLSILTSHFCNLQTMI